MPKQDYYVTLGVGRDASSDDLKRAYRKLAMDVHPDRNFGNPVAEARFKELNEAYDVLKDNQKRGAYDRLGHMAFEQNGSGTNYSTMADIFDTGPPDTSFRGTAFYLDAASRVGTAWRTAAWDASERAAYVFAGPFGDVALANCRILRNMCEAAIRSALPTSTP